MSRLDSLLDIGNATAVTLRRFLDAPEWQRPNEGLHFEHKADLSRDVEQVPKAVSAFANAEGGFLFLGAKAEKGTLVGFPGLPAGEEWPRRVSDLILPISPQPIWRPHSIACPEDAAKQVLILKVEQSPDPPHVLGGKVYVRTPGGTSDPVRDRATLDRLIERGREGRRLVRERTAQIEDDWTWRWPAGCWGFSAVAIPLPFGCSPNPKLLTRGGYDAAAQELNGTTLQGGYVVGALEDGVRIAFGAMNVVRRFSDGSMQAACESVRLHPSSENLRNMIEVSYLGVVVRDLLAFQAGRGVETVSLSVLLIPENKRLYGGQAHVRLVDEVIPLHDRWAWSTTTGTNHGSATACANEMIARLWRATGEPTFAK